MKAGKRFGRPLSISVDERQKIKSEILNMRSNITQLARKYGVSRTTIRRIRDE